MHAYVWSGFVDELEKVAVKQLTPMYEVARSIGGLSKVRVPMGKEYVLAGRKSAARPTLEGQKAWLKGKVQRGDITRRARRKLVGKAYQRKFDEYTTRDVNQAVRQGRTSDAKRRLRLEAEQRRRRW